MSMLAELSPALQVTVAGVATAIVLAALLGLWKVRP